MNEKTETSHDETQPQAAGIKPAHEDGHFYSPVCDPADLYLEEERIWPANPVALGIDFNEAYHRHVLTELFPKYFPDYQYPEHQPPESPAAFYTRNSQYSWLDSRAWFVLLRAWKPRRIIEVGCGFSSLLTADVNSRFLADQVEFSCIEPYPRDFLLDGIPGLSKLTVARVQDVPLAEFDDLRSGDVLFIDSSHVAKTGSDVNYLYFEVLPRLRPGVRIHIHDIFLPQDYPKEWALEENRSWNEQYVLRALLMYSTRFRVLFGSFYAYHQFPDLVSEALELGDRPLYGGSGLWIERTSN